MQSLSYRQSKIQEKRKNTSWKEFVMEICSWCPLVFSKGYGKVSRFPKTDRIGWVIGRSEFEEIRWTQTEEVNAESFMQGFGKLLSRSQFPAFMTWGDNENCDFADIVSGAKNWYLSIGLVTDVENVMYSRSVKNNCSNVIASVMVRKDSSNVFESSCIIGSFNVFYSHTIQASSNIRFSQNLVNCSECILCSDLENQSYCINNNQLSKEEYAIEKAKLLNDKSNFISLLQTLGHTEGNIAAVACEWHGITNSNNLIHWYYANQIQTGHNVVLCGSAVDNENVYDVISAWSPYGSNLYGGFSQSGEHHYCCCHTLLSTNVFYSYFLDSCSFCLWCIWLKNKSYCILNKQYEKDERYEKVDEIFSSMEATWTLWDFFPGSLNPFYFNDTAAYLIDPTFTKEEVSAAWYLRRDEPIKVDIPADAEVVTSHNLTQFEWWIASSPDDPIPGSSQWHRTINQDILKKVIQDEEGNYYRIVPMEYKFLVKHGLPLPRKHWLERMKVNFRIS